MTILQPLAHYSIHLLLPLGVAFFFFRSKWKMAYLIMLSGMFIDLDHLLANPIFNHDRCSINFHPLHSYYAMIIYLGLAILPKTRIIGIGLVIHILADTTDCLMM